jgi:hypothetical protein
MANAAGKSSTIVPAILFIAACIFLAFIAGVGISVFRISPYAKLEGAFRAFAAYSTQLSSTQKTPLHHLYPIRYTDTGAQTFLPEAVQPGVTLVTSHWKDEDKSYPGARLINMDGNTLHEWRVHPDKIWPESPYKDYAAGTKNEENNYIHGIWLLENGDIVFNIEYLGLVRMNACSEIVWKLPYRTHHSVFADDDGNFWVSGLKWTEYRKDEYWHLQPPFVDETLVKVSADGEILREIDVLKAIYDSGFEGLMVTSHRTKDVTHLNDVEVLSNALAPAFKSFNSGDLLVSLRNLNAIFVIDGKTEIIKWHLIHPLIHQHDPDFTSDGKIIVFNNRDDGTQNGIFSGQSRILEVDPDTKAITTKWPILPEQNFYSATGGKQQYLPNGNLLITEAQAGRILEIEPNGNIVWSWIKEGWGENLVPEVLEGSRYPLSFADFKKNTCK